MGAGELPTRPGGFGFPYAGRNPWLGALGMTGAEAEALLERGNGFFREMRWKEAETSYSEALDLLPAVGLHAVQTLRLRGLANRAAARLREKGGGGGAGALDDCQGALRLSLACRSKRGLAFKCAARMIEAAEAISDRKLVRHALAAARFYMKGAQEAKFVAEAESRLEFVLGSPEHVLDMMRFAASLGSPAELAAMSAACPAESPDPNGNTLLTLLSERARPPGKVLSVHLEAERSRQRVALESLKLLLGSGAPPDAQIPGKPSPLTVAVENGSLEAVELLLEAGANTEAIGPDGRTVLCSALERCKAQRVSVVKALLAAGADADARGPDPEMVAEELREKCKDPMWMMISPLMSFAWTVFLSRSPQMEPIVDGREAAEIFSMLLRAGARQDASSRDKAGYGFSAVALAMQAYIYSGGSSSEAVKALVDGAHPDDLERVAEDVRVMEFVSAVSMRLMDAHKETMEGRAVLRESYSAIPLCQVTDLLSLCGSCPVGSYPMKILMWLYEENGAEIAAADPLERTYAFMDAMTPEVVKAVYTEVSTSGDIDAVLDADDRARLKIIAGPRGMEEQHYFDSVQMTGRDGPVFVSPGWSAYYRLVQIPLQNTFALFVPCATALDVLAEHAPLLEIGSGSGYWAAQLRARGVDILTCDVVEDAENGFRGLGGRLFCKKYTKIQAGGVEVLDSDAADGRALFLTLPEPLDGFRGVSDSLSTWDAAALGAFRGEVLLLAGTPRGALATQLPKRFRLRRRVPLPAWPGSPEAPALTVWTRAPPGVEAGGGTPP